MSSHRAEIVWCALSPKDAAGASNRVRAGLPRDGSGEKVAASWREEGCGVAILSMISLMAPENRSSFVVRLTPTLHRSLKSWAEESGMSLNTLAVSILQWASDRGHAGEPLYEELKDSRSGKPIGITLVHEHPEPEHGVAWVGRVGGEEVDEETGEPTGDIEEGEVVFVIDDRPQSRIREAHHYRGMD